MKQLMTKWGAALDKNNVKAEYPRPRLVRDSYLNLNGEWDFCINTDPAAAEYDKTILVPFSPESALSGLGIDVGPEHYLHYRKTFILPEGFDIGRVILHFGAVDQECTVTLNGKTLGSHRGGYIPFSFDLSKALVAGENVIELVAHDMTEHAPYARGKQKIVKEGKYAWLFYTPTSGVWKPVWMESVPAEYVTGVRFTPKYDDAQVEMILSTTKAGKAKVTVSFEGETVFAGDVETDKAVCIDLPDFKAWSDKEPNLYDVAIEYEGDKVTSYFGMRVFEMKKDDNGILRFYLNKKPFIFNGLLDQGYWPDGVLTPASDAVYEFDIRTLKEMGFNTLRKHIKVEEERFYYLCDKIGMVVWQDMPNGGGEYNMTFVTDLTNKFDWFARGVEDCHYDLFAREDEEGRAQFYVEMKEMIDLLYSYPCIALWTPFNEGWGQFDANKATAMIREQDPTRLINEACGWFDQKGGDLYSIHNYKPGLAVKPQEDRAVALTEFGGYSYPAVGHTMFEDTFGYKAYQSREELTANYERLWNEEIYPNLKDGLSAIIYTQVSDVEHEINGVFSYDREVVKLIPETVKKLNDKLYEEFDKATK